jgi:tetratricopeptide (TPR) repeat protein
LLDPGERRLLARFSVFARGGSLEQLDLVCGPPADLGDREVVDALDQLADQSLLRRLPDFDEPRFLMLQTIREFAGERLEEGGEGAMIRDRHLEAFLALAQTAQEHLFGPQRKAWLDRLDADHDNFRVALEWCVAQGDALRAMRLGASLWRYWQMRGHLHEGRRRMAQILALPTSRVFPGERLAALEAAGGLAYWQADMDDAQRLYDECVEITRQLGDDRALANALYNAAFPRTVGARAVDEAKPMMTEAFELFRQLGDDEGLALTLWGMGLAFYYEGDYSPALPIFEEAGALNRKLDNRFGLAWSLHMLGLSAYALGDIERARKAFTEALRLFEADGDVPGLVFQLDNFAALADHDGDYLRAARLSGAALAHQASSGAGLGQLVRDQLPRPHRERLPGSGEATAFAEGQAMTRAKAAAYALEGAVTTPASGG